MSIFDSVKFAIFSEITCINAVSIRISLRSYGDRSDFQKIVVGPEFLERSEFGRFGELLNACVARTKPSEKFLDIITIFYTF